MNQIHLNNVFFSSASTIIYAIKKSKYLSFNFFHFIDERYSLKIILVFLILKHIQKQHNNLTYPLKSIIFLQYHLIYNLCDTILIIGSRYIICYRLYFLLCICHSNTDTRILYHRNIIKAVTTGYHIFP